MNLQEAYKRIKLLIYACAYEIFQTSLVSDEQFDKLSLEIDVNKPTNRPDLDVWFKDNFDTSTAMWIYNFPELEKLKQYTKNIYL